MLLAGMTVVQRHWSLLIALHTLTPEIQNLLSSRGPRGASPARHSRRNVGDVVLLVDPLHDAGNHLVGPNFDAALQALAQQRLNAQLPLDRGRQLQNSRDITQ
jgi:hypothetical protein